MDMKVDTKNQNGYPKYPSIFPNPIESQTPEGYGYLIPTDYTTWPRVSVAESGIAGVGAVQGPPMSVDINKVDLENENGSLSMLPISNPIQFQGPGRNGVPTNNSRSSVNSSDRKSLSLGERLEVIRLATTRNYSSRLLAAQFNCGRTQILSTLKQKSKYLGLAKLPGLIQRKRLGPKLRFGAVNERVEQWLNEAREQGNVVTGPILQVKAREIAAELGVNQFRGSNGWLESFRKRHGPLTPEQNSTPTDFEDNDHMMNSEDEAIPEVILEDEDELDWKYPTSSSSATYTCHPSGSSLSTDSTICPQVETFHVISLREALGHLEDLKTLAEALEDPNMLTAFTTQETVIKDIIVSRLDSPAPESRLSDFV